MPTPVVEICVGLLVRPMPGIIISMTIGHLTFYDFVIYGLTKIKVRFGMVSLLFITIKE